MWEANNPSVNCFLITTSIQNKCSWLGTHSLQIVGWFSKSRCITLVLHLDILPPFQIIGRLTFWLKFDHLSYSKFCAKYYFFCCGLLYQYKFFKSDLNLTMFVQIFWIRQVVKLDVTKVKWSIIRNGGSNNEMCYSTKTNKFSPTKQGLFCWRKATMP